MTGKLAKALAAAALVLTASSIALPATASADGLRFGIYMGEPYYAPPPRARHYGRHDDRRYYRRDRCSVHHARRKARRMGMHHPRVVRMNRHKLVVRGFRHGYRERVVFANRHGCPVIRYSF